MTAPLPSLATHGGAFHLDDVFAYAVLRLALGLREAGRDHVLVRTRDMAAIGGADLVWDVGAVYDPTKGRYDHHQRGAPVREDGMPLSAAGLVWLHHGKAAVGAVLEQDTRPSGEAHGADVPVAAIVARIDQEVVRRIDEIDNGAGPPGDALGLAVLVQDMNPSWDSSLLGDGAAEDQAFLQAAALVDGILRRRLEAVRAGLAAEALVLSAHARSADPQILELDRKMPWQAAAFAHALPVLYAVYPVPDGTWMVDAMPPEPGSFEQRLPLPLAWAGLRGAELAGVSGVPDAVFVHLRRFQGAARSREGALELARKSIAAAG